MLGLSVFTDYMTRKANGMTSMVSYMDQNSSYRGKIQGNWDLVRVSGGVQVIRGSTVMFSVNYRKYTNTILQEINKKGMHS